MIIESINKNYVILRTGYFRIAISKKQLTEILEIMRKEEEKCLEEKENKN